MMIKREPALFIAPHEPLIQWRVAAAPVKQKERGRDAVEVVELTAKQLDRVGFTYLV